MSRFERLYHLHNIFDSARAPIPRQRLMEELDCSQATLYRLINDLRDRLQAPLEKNDYGYYYDRSLAGHFALPGIWLSPEELQALLTARQLLSEVQPGLLEEELDNIQTRISGLLQSGGVEQEGEQSRINIQSVAARPVPERMFQKVLAALTTRKRLNIRYHGRGSDHETRRTVSPQRLTNYRNSWYLDAWCHQRKALRSFALERILEQEVLAEAARDVSRDELERHFGQSYGIFSGPARHRAVLRFSADRARWVADEIWHPDQQGEFLADGSYQLTIPYSHSGELLMDILKYGAEVEVLEPAELREEIRTALRQAAAKYS